jgi:endothelin-converting enzyme/putative endopeptidase
MKIKLNKGLLLAIPAMIVFAESQAQTVTQVKNRE